jgi:hypothetical protein
MKKLRLNLNIQKKILTKEQMRKISGGSSPCCNEGINCDGQGWLWECIDVTCPGACTFLCSFTDPEGEGGPCTLIFS